MSIDTDTDVLGVPQLVALSELLRAATGTRHVTYLSAYGDVIEGTARHFCRDQDGRFLRTDEDVRDAYLRITTVGGFEVFMPVREAMRKASVGEFVVD